MTKESQVKCKHCEQGMNLYMLDEDGVNVSLSGGIGTIGHAYEDGWWPCPRFDSLNKHLEQVRSESATELAAVRAELKAERASSQQLREALPQLLMAYDVARRCWKHDQTGTVDYPNPETFADEYFKGSVTLSPVAAIEPTGEGSKCICNWSVGMGHDVRCPKHGGGGVTHTDGAKGEE